MIKRILLLVCVGGFSGAENMSLLAAKEFINRGYEVIYCSPLGEIEDYIHNYYKGIEYVKLEKFRFCLIRRVVKLIQPDLIYAVDFKVSIITSMLNKPYIAHLHNNPCWLQKKSLKTVSLKYALNHSLANICVSNSIMDEYVYSNCIRKPTETILNVVDENKIYDMAQEKVSETYDIGFVGRICEQKNPIRFIELLNKINNTDKRRHSAIMIGADGGLMTQCMELRDKYNLDIKLTDFQKNPYKYISKCKIVLMPSNWEGFGLTAIESMLLGKPVLASPVGGLITAIGNSHFLCNCDDEFVYRAINLLNDSKEYAVISEKVKKQAKEFTDITKYVDGIEKLFIGH